MGGLYRVGQAVNIRAEDLTEDRDDFVLGRVGFYIEVRKAVFDFFPTVSRTKPVLHQGPAPPNHDRQRELRRRVCKGHRRF